MSLTEAQKRAKEKYNKKVTKITIEFYPQDDMLIQHLRHQDNKQSYIKDLIRKDMLNFESVQSLHNERMRELGRLQERVARKLADANAKVATKEVEEQLTKKDIR